MLSNRPPMQLANTGEKTPRTTVTQTESMRNYLFVKHTGPAKVDTNTQNLNIIFFFPTRTLVQLFAFTLPEVNTQSTCIPSLQPDLCLSALPSPSNQDFRAPLSCTYTKIQMCGRISTQMSKLCLCALSVNP